MTGNQLDVIIDNKPIRALVDSGASFSVISDKYRRFLKKVLFSEAKNITLKVADGSFVRPIGKCILRVSINSRELPFEFIVLPHCSHDIILGWDFLEASRAVVDCGRSELMLDDMMQDPQSFQTWRLNTLQDSIVPPRSIAKLIVTNPKINTITDAIVEGNRSLMLSKEVAVPSTILTFQDGKAELWVTNVQRKARFIPKGMCVGYAEALDERYLSCISDTKACATAKEEVGAFPVDYSQMLSSDLTVEQKQQLLKLLSRFPEIFDQGILTSRIHQNIRPDKEAVSLAWALPKCAAICHALPRMPA